MINDDIAKLAAQIERTRDWASEAKRLSGEITDALARERLLQHAEELARLARALEVQIGVLKRQPA